MQQNGLFVEKLYTIPEIRAVTPGHLVRCGHSSAYDVNFGKEAGAGAVLLLKNGIIGVSVVGISGNEVRYKKTEELIKQRHVDLAQVAIYENMGVCFGRTTTPLAPVFKEVTGTIERIY